MVYEDYMTVIFYLLFIVFTAIFTFIDYYLNKPKDGPEGKSLDPLNALSIPKEYKQHLEYPLERIVFSGYLRGRKEKYIYFVLFSRCGDYVVKEIKLKSLKTGIEYREFEASYLDQDSKNIEIESPFEKKKHWTIRCDNLPKSLFLKITPKNSLLYGKNGYLLNSNNDLIAGYSCSNPLVRGTFGEKLKSSSGVIQHSWAENNNSPGRCCGLVGFNRYHLHQNDLIIDLYKSRFDSEKLNIGSIKYQGENGILRNKDFEMKGQNLVIPDKINIKIPKETNVIYTHDSKIELYSSRDYFFQIEIF